MTFFISYVMKKNEIKSEKGGEPTGTYFFIKLKDLHFPFHHEKMFDVNYDIKILHRYFLLAFCII